MRTARGQACRADALLWPANATLGGFAVELAKDASPGVCARSTLGSKDRTSGHWSGHGCRATAFALTLCGREAKRTGRYGRMVALLRAGLARRISRSARHLPAALLVSVSMTGVASATIVERVVAVVGDRPILLSDVRTRTTPFQKGLPPNPSERAAAQSALFSQMLDKMVEEELIARAAVKAQVRVTREEIDAAIERVAQGNNVDVEALLAEVEASGVTRSQYRAEIRRQLVDAKVVNLRLQGRLRVSEDEVRAEYESLLEQERQQLPVRVAVVRIATSAANAAATAQAVSAAARQGADFAQLCRLHSTSEELRADGGLLDRMAPDELSKELRRASLRLDVGEISAPVKSGDDWVVLKVVERDPSSLPPFEEAIDQLRQRVQLKKMERARADWLKTLRRQYHVEVRL